jgi:hypothetical protein
MTGTCLRECLETWQLQSKAGPVTVESLEVILARATIPILRQVEWPRRSSSASAES